jgi:TRAP-type C4-dicarboxylate transport system substrate-binding protein
MDRRQIMMQRRNILRGAAAVALGAPALGAFAQETFTFRFHTFMTSNSDTWALLCKPWMEKVTAESNGRIRFEGYPAMQLGGAPAQLYDQVKDGTVDFTWTLPGLTPGRFPRVEAFELPFIMNKPEATSKALWEYTQTHAADEFKDVHPIALHVSGPGVFHSRSKAILSTADLKGLKVRGPSRQVTKLLLALGATPVGMPLPAVADAILKGTIDAAVLPWQTVPAVRLQELTRFHSEFPAETGALYTTVFLMAANKAKIDALPADLRRVINNNSGLATSAWCGKTTASTDPIGRKSAADLGNSIATINRGEADAFANAAAHVSEEWVGEINKRGHDGKKLLEAAKALIVKHGLA